MRRSLDTNICGYILRGEPLDMVERFFKIDRSPSFGFPPLSPQSCVSEQPSWVFPGFWPE